MIYIGFAATFVIWLTLYGGNVLNRQWVLRRYLAKHEPIAKVEVVYPTKKVNNRRWVILIILFASMMRTLSHYAFAEGVFAAALVIALLWPLYLRSQVCVRLLLLFDRQGVTVFPVNRRLVSQGTFQTRLNWVDCFGYSIYRGHALFALRGGGQIEQVIGNRMQVSEVLNRLGIRKLKAYDHLEPREVTEDDLHELEQQVDRLAQDIVGGYQADAAAMGLHLQAEVQQADDSEQQTEPYAFLKMSLWDDAQMVDELDWLLWARYEKAVELLHLPQERLYEALDERVLSLLEAQTREKGRKSPPLLQ